jgi:hypothetical protein
MSRRCQEATLGMRPRLLPTSGHRLGKADRRLSHYVVDWNWLTDAFHREATDILELYGVLDSGGNAPAH